MIEKLDNALVLMLSEKGHYGTIKTLDSNDDGIEVCYLAICRYENDNAVYLFLCDKDMSVEQDGIFDCVGKAIADAQKRSHVPIVWSYSSTGV